MPLQNLVESILRKRIYNDRYWKEQCFGLTGALRITGVWCEICVPVFTVAALYVLQLRRWSTRLLSSTTSVALTLATASRHRSCALP